METRGAEQLLERDSELSLRLLSINDMPRAWKHVEPLLQEACKYSSGAFTPELVLAGMGLHDGVESLRMLAMIDGEKVTSIMVVAVTRAPTGKQSLECLLTAGEDVRAWMPFEPQMDDWARSMGCTNVKITRARWGWQKMLPHWKRTGIVLEREL